MLKVHGKSINTDHARYLQELGCRVLLLATMIWRENAKYFVWRAKVWIFIYLFIFNKNPLSNEKAARLQDKLCLASMVEKRNIYSLQCSNEKIQCKPFKKV